MRVVELRKEGATKLQEIKEEKEKLLETREKIIEQEARKRAMQEELVQREEKLQAIRRAEDLFRKARQGKRVDIVYESSTTRKYFNQLVKGRTAQFFELKRRLEQEKQEDPPMSASEVPKDFGEESKKDGAVVDEDLFKDMVDRASKGDTIIQGTLDKVAGIVTYSESDNLKSIEQPQREGLVPKIKEKFIDAKNFISEKIEPVTKSKALQKTVKFGGEFIKFDLLEKMSEEQKQKQERAREIQTKGTLSFIETGTEKSLERFRPIDDFIQEKVFPVVSKTVGKTSTIREIITASSPSFTVLGILQQEKKVTRDIKEGGLKTALTIEKDISSLDFQKGLIKGGLSYPIESPESASLLIPTGFAFGIGTRLAGAGVVKLGAGVGGVSGAVKAGKVSQTILGVGGGALITESSIVTGMELSAEPNREERGKIIARELEDLGLFVGGATAGERAGSKLVGFIRTRGGKEISIEDIGDPQVLSGEKKYPVVQPGETASQVRERFFEPLLPGEEPGLAIRPGFALTEAIKGDVSAFEFKGSEIPRGFTAVDISAIAEESEIGIGKVITVEKRGKGSKRDVLTGEFKEGIETIKSEFPGVFIADRPSTAFLRGKGEEPPKLFGLGGFGGEPTLIRRELRDIIIPKTDRARFGKTKARIKEAERKLGGRRGLTPEEIAMLEPELKSGEAFMPFTKGEREAIIVKGTKEETIARDFFTIVDGQRVPIVQRRFIESEPITKGTKKRKTKVRTRVKDAIERFRIRAEDVSEILPPSRSSIITPSRVGVSSRILRNSDISKIVSDVSKISGVSKVGKVSKPSKISRINEISEPSIPSEYLFLSPPSYPPSSPPGYPPSYPKEPSFKNPIFLPIFRKQRKRKKTKEERMFDEPLVIVEGFTGRVIGRKRKIKEKDLLKTALKFESGLGIRGTPMIVRNKNKVLRKPKRKPIPRKRRKK